LGSRPALDDVGYGAGGGQNSQADQENWSHSALVTDEPPRRNPWRPTTLTIRRFLRICHFVEKGWAISRACEAESITYSHFRLRVSRSSLLQERVKQAETVRFNLRHEQALESIMAAGERNWMAHAWWLERNLPHLYACET
jgi:hypothetical protein